MVIKRSNLVRSRNNGLILEENIINLLKEGEETFVIDDYSTDPYTIKILRRFANVKYWNRIIIWRHKKPMGYGENINFLIKRARGKYFLIIDADTLYIPNSFDVLVKRMKELPETVKAIGLDIECMTNNRDEACSSLSEKAPLLAKDLSYAPIYYGVFKREVFRRYRLRFDERYGRGYGFEEWDFGLKMYRYGLKSVLVQAKWYSHIKTVDWWRKQQVEDLKTQERYRLFKRIWGEPLCQELEAKSALNFFKVNNDQYAELLLMTRDASELEKLSPETKEKIKEFWEILDIYQQKNPEKYEAKRQEFIKKLTNILYGL